MSAKRVPKRGDHVIWTAADADGLVIDTHSNVGDDGQPVVVQVWLSSDDNPREPFWVDVDELTTV